MNLDIYHPNGKPPVEMLKVPMVRLLYNVSRGTGNLDFNRAYNDYAPYINQLLNAGKKVVLVLNHQTAGEGTNWNTVDWPSFIGWWASTVHREVINRFPNSNIIWQVWNEADQASEAAVGVPAYWYGQMYSIIKVLAPTKTIITSGLVSGPGNAINYIKAANIIPDGYAIHSYGRIGAFGPNKYNQFGFVEDELREWRRYTTRPLYITEYGLLDRQNEPDADVALFVKNFRAGCKQYNVEPLWYAAGRSMHDGYGWFENGQIVRPQTYNALTGGAASPIPDPTPNDGIIWVRKNFSGSYPRIRQEPGLDGKILGTTAGHMDVDETTPAKDVDGYIWKRCRRINGDAGWFALVSGLTERVL